MTTRKKKPRFSNIGTLLSARMLAKPRQINNALIRAYLAEKTRKDGAQ